MRYIQVVILIGLLFATHIESADAATRVRGYVKPSSGHYVQPHYRSSSNSFKFDNYSSRGNSNPFTGKRGYKKWY